MLISVRECHLPGVFGTIKDGLEAMKLDCVELEYSRDRGVLALDASDGAHVSLATDDAIKAFADRCSQLGVKASALLMHNNFGAEDLDAEVDWTISCIGAASKLGVKAVRIDAAMRLEGDWPLEKRTARFADSMSRVLEATSGLDVQMGIENHGKQGNEPEFLDGVIDAVNHPRLGITIDTGNFYWAGNPIDRVHEIIEHFAPRLKHTHIKSINYPADQRGVQREVGWEYGKYASPLREGDIDLRRVIAAFKKAGYTGDLCIENESLGRFDEGKRKEVLVDDADYLREILAEMGNG